MAKLTYIFYIFGRFETIANFIAKNTKITKLDKKFRLGDEERQSADLFKIKNFPSTKHTQHNTKKVSLRTVFETIPKGGCTQSKIPHSVKKPRHIQTALVGSPKGRDNLTGVGGSQGGVGQGRKKKAATAPTLLNG